VQHVQTACRRFFQSEAKLQGAIRPAMAGLQASRGFKIYFIQPLGSVCGVVFHFF